ncbi:hypothetical protein IP88_00470 [alpha proteobacterium AAP81b]|nr:hypothetical protein IP88_00470 [alpha proteobacterium AAP81b]
MGQIFYLLMERIAGLSGPDSEWIVGAELRQDFDAIFARFKTLINYTYDGARNCWEEACWQHIAGYDIDPNALGTIRMEKDRVLAFPEYPRVVPFMNIANEVYHLAYSAGAARSVALGAGSDLSAPIVGVATAFVTAFPDLVSEETVDADFGVDETTLERMNQLLVTLPRNVEFGDDFSFVFDMRWKTEVLEAANEYLNGLELFMRGGIEFDEGIRRRDAYIEQLSSLMAFKLRFKKRWVAGKGFSDLLLAGATSPLQLHFAAGWLLSFGLDPLRNRLIERMLKARVSSALREEGLRAASAGLGPSGQRPVPLARTMGLYLGPLHTNGLKQLVTHVDPYPAARAALEAADPAPQSERDSGS